MRWLDGITDLMDVSLTLGVGDGLGGLVCCDSWGHKESDTTERLNGTELKNMRLLLKTTTTYTFKWSLYYFIIIYTAL